MRNQYGLSPIALNLLGALDSPIQTTYRDQWKARQEELAAEREAVNAPQPENNNAFFQRSAGEVAGDTWSGLAKGVNSVGSAFVQMGDASAELQKSTNPVSLLFQHYFPEAAANSEEKYQQRLQGAEDLFQSGQDYWQDKKSDKIKSDAAYVGQADGIKDTLSRIAEKPQVVGDMLADSAAFMVPGGWAARAMNAIKASAGAIAGTSMGVGALLDAGATGAQTKQEVMAMTPEQLMERSPDYKALIEGGASPEQAKMAMARDAGFTAQAIQLPISFLASKLTGAGKLESEFFTGQGAKGFFASLLKETGEEGVQEASAQAAQNTGVKLFADNERQVTQDVGKNATLGMIAGTAQGGGMNLLSTAARMTGRNSAIADNGVDTPVNGEQFQADEQAPIVEDLDLPLQVDPIINTGDTNNPDDRFKFELNADSFVANIRRNLDAKKAGAAKAQFQYPEIRTELNAPETDMASAARPYGEQNGFIAPPKDPNVVDYVPPVINSAPKFELAPMDNISVPYENSIEFVPPSRTNELAGGVEKAISANIDSARNARMPENLKDTRLLRTRYRNHINDVMTALDQSGDGLATPSSLLDLAAQNGGLNSEAWAKEGLDQADTKSINGSQFEKAFRADGGMTPDDLAEFAAQRGFSGFTNAQGAPDANAALNAVNEELRGNKQFSLEQEAVLQAAQSAPKFISELKEFGEPQTIRRALSLALEGKKLGDNQLRIVQEVLDNTNSHARDDKAIKEKWEVRSKAMLANRANKRLDEWRNRDEHLPDATTHEAALNEIMSDAIQHYGIDAEDVKAAYDKYSAKYPNMNNLVAAMSSWVSATKPDTSEHLNYGKNQSPGRSSGQRGTAEGGPRVSLASKSQQEATAPRGDARPAQAESKGDSAGRDTGLRQPVKPIEGRDIDGDWANFSDDSGSLKIPRAEMPQIKAEHRGAMVNFLNARGVAHQEETVPAESLKPTQAEFSREKVARAKSYEGGNRSILISSDNHVLDGHHQWMAARDNGEDVKVIRLDAPIKDLVKLAHEFPSSTTDDATEIKAALNSGIKYKLDNTDSEEFTRWFGDSKVVDADGKPLTVYHGTDENFSVFDNSRIGGALSASPSALGHWFVDDQEYASWHGDNVIDAYLSIKKPKTFTRGEWVSLSKRGGFDKLRKELESAGYDGVMIEADSEEFAGTSVRNPAIFSAFRPEQIKSATSNNGEFNSSNPDIRFKKSEAGSESKLSRDSAQAIIDRISKNWKVNVKINLIGSIAELPQSVKSRLRKADDEQKEPAALIDESTGNVYINLSRAESEKTIEELIFHEVYTHFGLSRLMGPKMSGIMTRMYLNLGKSEFDRLAKKYNVNTKLYEQDYSDRSNEYRQAILAEELLAHMAEHHKPTVVRLAQEFIGAVRSWLRGNGFATLSKISEDDLRYLLKQSRETVTVGKQGNITGLIYSMAGLTNAERKQLNAERKADKNTQKNNSRNIDNDLVDLWAAISRDEESYQLPISKKKDFVEIAQEIEGYNGFTVRDADELALQNRHGAERAWRVVTPKGDKAVVFQKGDSVWIDVSDLSSGDDGKRIYNMAANYAYNNNKVFKGDPAGLSITAKSRRLENMISSALKFGTTDHLQPHRLQLVTSHGVPGLKWRKGDTENNIREMIKASYESVKNQFPEIGNLVYNPETDEFQDAENGTEFTRQDFRELARKARGLHEPSAGGPTPTAGSTTLERAVLTGSILRGTSSERSRILEQIGQQRSERLKDILYSLDKTETRPQGGFSVSGLRKYIPGAKREAEARSLPPDLQESFSRLGQKKTFVARVKLEVKRQLTPEGLLPKEIFDLKVSRDGQLNSDELHTRHTLQSFYDAVQSAYGMPYQQLKNGTKREINKVLRGEPDARLAPSVIQALSNMRGDVKRLSAIYVRQLAADAAELQTQGKVTEAESKLRMIEIISANFDTYLHRSYRAFDDKDWPNKVPPKVYQEAINFLASEYADGGTVNAEHIKLAEKRAHMILHEGTAFDSIGAFIAESKLGSKDLSIMKKRKEVPEPIRALLGEYEDAAMNYTKSVTKMSRLVHNHAFLTGMRETAFNLGLLHEKQNLELDATKKIAGEASEAYAPLNGLYTTREFDQALKDAMGKTNPNAVYDAIVAFNGMVKFGKTVLSPTTAFRNFMSSMFFTLSNGHFDYTQAAKSFKAAQVYFKDRGDAGIKDYMEKLRKLGVIYDSPHAGELMDLLKDSQKLEGWMNRKEGWLLGLSNATREGLEWSQKFYSFGDDFYKIIGFENEKALLIKHKKLSETEAEKKAAERIRNTYPTYSMVGKGVNTLRRFPLVGTFVSFPAEIIRTSYHITNYLRQDIKELGIKNPMVQRKLMGYAIAAGVISGISALSAAWQGVGDDEEKALRAMAPEWTKNSNILWLGRDDKGNRRYVDLSFLDPYGYWKRPINAVMQDQPLGEALASGVNDLLSPFFGLDITAKAIGETLFNDKVDGGKIYNELDSTESIVGDISTHLRKALQPGVFTNVERFILAGMDAKSKTGKQYQLDEEIAALLGWRAGTFDPKVALYYQAFEYQDKKASAAKLLSSVATDINNVNDDEIRAAYIQSLKARKEAFDDMRAIVEAGKLAGLNQQQLRSTLRNSGVSIKDAIALTSPEREPSFVASKTVMKGAIKKAAALFDQETQNEFKRREKYINGLRKQAAAHQLELDQDE